MGWPDKNGIPYGYEQLTITNSAAVELTVPTTPPPTFLIIMLEGGDTRYRVDGTGDPTISIGMPFREGDLLNLNCGEGIKFRVIAQTSTNATLYVTYYKGPPFNF